jgi:hypothetical protein
MINHPVHSSELIKHKHIFFIVSGEVADMTKFSKETKKSKDRRKRERKAEAAEAEDYAKELGLTDDQSSLERAIMQRQVKIIIIFMSEFININGIQKEHFYSFIEVELLVFKMVC